MMPSEALAHGRRGPPGAASGDDPRGVGREDGQGLQGLRFMGLGRIGLGV